MSIQLQAQQPAANATLTQVQVQTVLSALSGVVTLPEGKDFASLVALNVTVQANGAGVINTRFNK